MGMRDLSRKSAQKVSDELQHQELEMLMDTDLDTASLSPSLKSHEKYDELIKVIQSASSSNLSVAQLEQRIKELGEDSWDLAKKLVDLAK